MTAISSPFEGNSDNHGWFHPQLEPTDTPSPHHPFGYIQRGNEENDHIPFLDGKPLAGSESKRNRSWYFRAESELESESLKICRLRSPGWNWRCKVSRLRWDLDISICIPRPLAVLEPAQHDQMLILIRYVNKLNYFAFLLRLLQTPSTKQANG